MKTHSLTLALAALLLPLLCSAQVNSGSNGSDGALNPTANLVIDMADHPDGIYHYTSVNITGVTVSFIPNAANTPVVWLVQGDCTMNGLLRLYGQDASGSNGAVGGPGGFRGGNGGALVTAGQGPGGGLILENRNLLGGNASFGTAGESGINGGNQYPAGSIYGNKFLLPFSGGSGGSGSPFQTEMAAQGGSGGGGGGGALLIAASGEIRFDGTIWAYGGNDNLSNRGGGGGSGGAVRFIATTIRGSGYILCAGGKMLTYDGGTIGNNAGKGRVRFDTYDNLFGGPVDGVFTQGFQPIILPAPGQGIQLGIQSVGGVAVAANPSGVLANPDVIIPAQQTNPVSVVVNCTNVPLNSEITVVVHPANGADVQAVGLNNAGTAAASTATLSLNMPRGGGIIYAKAVTGIAGTASTGSRDATRSLAETGWTATGERFKAIEVTAALGGAQRIAYITESGKRYEAQ